MPCIYLNYSSGYLGLYGSKTENFITLASHSICVDDKHVQTEKEHFFYVNSLSKYLLIKRSALSKLTFKQWS